MDWHLWCKLCGNTEAILQADQEQKDVICKLTEVKIVI